MIATRFAADVAHQGAQHAAPNADCRSGGFAARVGQRLALGRASVMRRRNHPDNAHRHVARVGTAVHISAFEGKAIAFMQAKMAA